MKTQPTREEICTWLEEIAFINGYLTAKDIFTKHLNSLISYLYKPNYLISDILYLLLIS